MKKIKEYMRKYKTEIKNMYEEYREKYLTEVEKYIDDKLEKRELELNAEIVSIVSALMYERDLDFETAIELLENYMEDIEEYLSDRDLARLYTNLAYYYVDLQDCMNTDKDYVLEYLEKARDLNSKYPQTYLGLGIYYYDKYEMSVIEKKMIYAQKYLNKSKEYYKKAYSLSKDYMCMFSYGAILFTCKEYERAKYYFEKLIKEYPDRQIVIYGLACCEAMLKNEEKVLELLKNIKVGEDGKYDDYYNDEIENDYVKNIYYILEKYQILVDETKGQEISDEIYVYSLKKLGLMDEIDNYIKNNRINVEKLHEEFNQMPDENLIEEFGKEKYEELLNKIAEDTKKKLEEFEKQVEKILKTDYKPEADLYLFPILGCYLIDCFRH